MERKNCSKPFDPETSKALCEHAECRFFIVEKSADMRYNKLLIFSGVTGRSRQCRTRGGFAMKKAIIAMLVMFFLVVWPCGGIWGRILSPIIGGNTEQTFIYPIYIGIILLAGLIVVCTSLIISEIRSNNHKD